MEQINWVFMLVKVGVVFLALVHVVPIMAWVERRGSALMQNRLGPNRVGPLGLLQALADAIKFIFKEDRIPGHVKHKFFYLLAPTLAVIPAFMTFAIVPFASSIEVDGQLLNFQIADLNVGLLYVFAIGSLGVYGIIMGSWASNSKYALFGGLRSASQMVSYELSLGLSVIGMIMATSSIELGPMVQYQALPFFELGPITIPRLGVFIQPLGFLIFLTAIFAETNRLPFDLPEGESEIVAGYHLEYGAMKFALFMMAEYVHMTTGAAVISTLYFGGYQLLPGMPAILEWVQNTFMLYGVAGEWARIAFEILSFTIKVGFFLWFFVWVRWTLPRFRYDQLMGFGWKVMLPLSLLNIFITAILIYYGVF